ARAEARPPVLVHGELSLAARAVRDAAGGGLARVLIDDRARHAELRRFATEWLPGLADRIDYHPGSVFDLHEVEEQIDRALAPRVALPSGGEIVIERTEAFVAIDVNTGSGPGRGRFQDTLLATNLEAAREVARQLRLRNLSGRIVVDFAGFERPHGRDQVLAALEEAAAADRLPVRVAEVTESGLVELTRKRARDSLDGTLLEPCGPCGGRGSLKTALTVALEALRAIQREARERPAARLDLVAAPDVVAALDGEAREARLELEGALGGALRCAADAGRSRESFEVVSG
ncbi:MAG: ribonuclease E/G, partial [Alphaproteobacteria bacterium]